MIRSKKYYKLCTNKKCSCSKFAAAKKLCINQVNFFAFERGIKAELDEVLIFGFAFTLTPRHCRLKVSSVFVNAQSQQLWFEFLELMFLSIGKHVRKMQLRIRILFLFQMTRDLHG